MKNKTKSKKLKSSPWKNINPRKNRSKSKTTEKKELKDALIQSISHIPDVNESNNPSSLLSQSQQQLPINLKTLNPRPLDLEMELKQPDFRKDLWSNHLAVFESRYESEIRPDRIVFGLIYRPRFRSYCIMMNEQLYWFVRLSTMSVGMLHPNFMMRCLREKLLNARFFLHAPTNKWGGPLTFLENTDITILPILMPQMDGCFRPVNFCFDQNSIDGKTILQFSGVNVSFFNPMPSKIEIIPDVIETQRLLAANSSPDVRRKNLVERKIVGPDEADIAVRVDWVEMDNWVILESKNFHKLYNPRLSVPH